MSAKAPDYVSVTGDALVKTGSGVLYSVTVTAAMSAAVTTFYDNTAESGTAILVIPASTAAGTVYAFPQGVRFRTGLYAGFAGTGTLCIAFR